MSRKTMAQTRCALCGAKEVSEPRGDERYCRDCWDKKIAVEEIVSREFVLKRYIRAHSAEKHLVYHSTQKRPCGQIVVVDDGYDLFLTMVLYPTFGWDDEAYHALATRTVRLARERGALSVLPIGLAYLAGSQMFNGDFAAAGASLEEADTVRAATCIVKGDSSPAILYMLGIMRSRPCDAVNVVVSAPPCSAPCTAPAAPASDCISTTSGTLPHRFRRPWFDHSSESSPMVDDGVIR